MEKKSYQSVNLNSVKTSNHSAAALRHLITLPRRSRRRRRRRRRIDSSSAL